MLLSFSFFINLLLYSLLYYSLFYYFLLYSFTHNTYFILLHIFLYKGESKKKMLSLYDNTKFPRCNIILVYNKISAIFNCVLRKDLFCRKLSYYET